MLERRYWYALNAASLLIGAIFIGWIMPFLLVVFPGLAEALSIHHPSDITVLWLFFAMPVLMMIDLATGSKEELKRKTVWVYLLLYLSVMLTQLGLGSLFFISWVEEWSALFFPLILLLIDAVLIRTLLRRLVTPPAKPNI